MKQYAYNLLYRTVTGGGTNEHGQVLQGIVSWIDAGPCRDEVRTGNNQVLVAGNVTTFTAFVFTPVDCVKLLPGTKIKVLDVDGDVRIEGDVKQFRRGAMHCRIWV